MLDVFEVRREALRQVINDQFGGSQASFAEAMGIKPPQVSRWLSVTAKTRQNINEHSARRIEEVCKKPQMWMDAVDLFSEIPRLNAPGGLQEVAHAWELADRWDREIALAWANAVLKRTAK